ncbi:MAG TPA: GIY-YIG nuclease family protein [Armatimonadota bacterium]
MKYVYLLQSISDASRYYSGSTDDFPERLTAHNAGKSPHTSKYMPWKAVVVCWFADEQRAAEFERYLKSGSGRAR